MRSPSRASNGVGALPLTPRTVPHDNRTGSSEPCSLSLDYQKRGKNRLSRFFSFLFPPGTLNKAVAKSKSWVTVPPTISRRLENPVVGLVTPRCAWRLKINKVFQNDGVMKMTQLWNRRERNPHAGGEARLCGTCGAARPLLFSICNESGLICPLQAGVNAGSNPVRCSRRAWRPLPDAVRGC